MGYFNFERFVSKDGPKTDEIAIDSDYFVRFPVLETMRTLVH